jgi:uncharacterized RDD family membrane protein YckC
MEVLSIFVWTLKDIIGLSILGLIILIVLVILAYNYFMKFVKWIKRSLTKQDKQ